MNIANDDAAPNAISNPNDSSTATASTGGLRTWLIIVTIVAALAFVATIPGVLFGTYMAAFAADDPSVPAGNVVNIMVGVWAGGAGFLVLLIAGVVGGWIAYRKQHPRLSLGLSLLAAVPIILIILAIMALVVLNIVWTASLYTR